MHILPFYARASFSRLVTSCDGIGCAAMGNERGGVVAGGVLMADFAAHPNEKQTGRVGRKEMGWNKTRTRELDATGPLGLNTASRLRYPRFDLGAPVSMSAQAVRNFARRTSSVAVM
jgi:hypothetical protein